MQGTELVGIFQWAMMLKTPKLSNLSTLPSTMALPLKVILFLFKDFS